MKHLRRMSAIALVLVSAHVPQGAQTESGAAHAESGPVPRMIPVRPSLICSVSILRKQPDHLYPVSHIEQMVRDAEFIVRAVAVGTLPVSPDNSMPSSDAHTVDRYGFVGMGPTAIRFRSIEVLRGPSPAAEFTIDGYVEEEDDFNTLPVPYRLVRAAGTHGDCYARAYRLSAEYLILLRRRNDTPTPHWFPLGPTNEQIRGDDDPWLLWVRGQLAGDPGPESRPPLR